MATTKTLTPTNQSITLAAFTEKPDNRVNVTNDDRLADAVNALNSKTSINIALISGSSRAEILSNIDALVSGAGQAFFYMSTSISEIAGLERQTYFCTLSCQNANVRVISAVRGGIADVATLQRTSSGWANEWLSISSKTMKMETATVRTSSSGWIYFPQNRNVLFAVANDTLTLILSYDADNNRMRARNHIIGASASASIAQNSADTDYEVRYYYF